MNKVVRYVALDCKVLAVLVKRIDGWTAYIGAVDGIHHDYEYQQVAETGAKLKENVALAIFPKANELGSYCS